MKKLSDDQIADCAALYAAGVSSPELAERFGVSAPVMRGYLHEAGVQMRPTGGDLTTSHRQRAAMPTQPHATSTKHEDQSTPAMSIAAAFPGRVALSPEEFADAVGIGRTLVYLALKKGTIPHRRIGRRFIIPLIALDRWLNGGAGGTGSTGRGSR
jgi:excisionase family DNA binding protein